jgi:hypothetical protein
MSNEIPVAPVGELPTPPATYEDSLTAAVERPWYQIHGAIDDIFQMGTQRHRREMADTLDVMNQTLGDPRLSRTQGALNYIAELGSSLASTAPLAVAGTAIAGEIGAAVGLGAEAVLPEGAINFLRKPLNKLITSEAADYLPGASVSAISKGVFEAYGAYKGMIIPEHVVENFNKVNDTLNGQQALTDWSHDNWGFMIPAPFLVGGFLLHKVLKARGEAKVLGAYAQSLAAQHEQVRSTRQKVLASALERAEKAAKLEGLRSNLESEVNKAYAENRISREDYAWWTAYFNDPNDTERLTTLGLHVLEDIQKPVDRATGRVWFSVIDDNKLKQLKQALSDRFASDLPKEDQAHVMDYVVNNSIDETTDGINKNAALKNALKGMMVFGKQKLASGKKVTKAAKKLLKDHVFVERPKVFEEKKFPYLKLENQPPEKVKRLKTLYELQDQPERYANALAKYQKKYPDIEQELHYLLGDMLSQENIFNHLASRNLNPKNFPMTLPAIVREKLAIREQLKGLTKKKDIKPLKSRNYHLKFETIPKEIERLTNELESNLKPDYKKSESYKRLEDLAESRDDAKQALGYLDMLNEYKKQEAMLNAINNFVEIADSTAAKFADPNKVISYMNKRLEQSFPKLGELKAAEAPKKIEIPQEGKEPLKVDAEKAEKNGAYEVVKELQEAVAKQKEFSENLDVLEDAVKCVWESVNG